PVVVLLALLLALASAVVEDLLETNLQRDLRQVARAVHLPVARALESSDEEQLTDSLESIFALSEVYGVYVLDEDGELVASVGSVQPSESQSFRAVALS